MIKKAITDEVFRMLDARYRLATALAASLLVLVMTGCVKEDVDPYLWLEDIDGEEALEWVRTQNARTAERLTSYPDLGVH